MDGWKRARLGARYVITTPAVAAVAVRRFDIGTSLPRPAAVRQWDFGPQHRTVAYRVAIVSSLTLRGALGLLLCGFLAVAACSSDGDGDPLPEAAPNTVVVVDPGDGEVALLRWQPTAGDSAVFEVLIAIDTVVEIDDLKQEATIGPAAVTFDAEVTAIGPDGEITTRYEVVAAGVPDGSDPALDEAMKRSIGSTIIETVSATGILTQRDVVPASSLGGPEQAQLDRFIEQLAAVFSPLPTEPVGTGASWTYTAAANVQGVDWLRTTTYELTQLMGSELVLGAQIQNVAEFQEVDPAGPTSLEGAISGESTSSSVLSELSPRQFESTTALDADIFTGGSRTGRTANRTESTLLSVDSDS